jgi:YidC/Oxa1 family membrane protein insertase
MVTNARRRETYKSRFQERIETLTQYHNPQQEPGSERRLLLVFALTFVVLIVFQPLLSRYLHQGQPAQPPGQKAPATQPPPAAQPPASAPEPKAAAPASAPPTARTTPSARTTARAGQTAVPVRQAQAESETVVENDLYRITFTNRGGLVKSWVLKKHQDTQGHPLELVHQVAASQFGYPFGLWTYDQGLRDHLNSALYVPSETGEQKSPTDITFEYSDGSVQVRKTFHFDHSYVVGVNVTVQQNGEPVRAYLAWPAGFGDQQTAASYASSRVQWEYGDEVQRLAAKAVSGGNTLTGPFQWVGVVDQYFGAVFLPGNPSGVNAVTLRNAIDVRQKPFDPQSKQFRAEVLGIAVGSTSGPTSERVFVGPKTLDVLESIKVTPVAGQAATPNLGKVVDFGKWLGWIAYPLFLWLRWTYHHIIANWGWAIVVLTVIINLVLFPLRLSSMKSAMKMQKVQPQMNAIKEKYKKYSMRDPRRQEMNQEMAELFKREGANPAGGCLPLLIQMPFLFAFYSMLENATELRNASFLWMRDLSSPDPYYLIPILIIVTTFAMQKMTPQAGMDPAQQKVMTVMMPIMLGVISWSLSAGLGVYWILGNIIGIGQQQFLNSTHFGKEVRAAAEKRARQRKDKKDKSPVGK